MNIARISIWMIGVSLSALAFADGTIYEFVAKTRAENKKGIVTSSSVKDSSHAGEKAFDLGVSGNSASVWRSNGKGEQWLRYDFNSGFQSGKFVQLFSYGLCFNSSYQGALTAATCQMPKTWQFQGSNDGETWTTLDERTDFVSWQTFSYFLLATPASYCKYRLVMTAAVGASATDYSVTEVRLFGLVLDDPDELSGYSWPTKSGDWNESANWHPVGVPTAGAHVLVLPGVQMNLVSTTARLASLNLSGMLSMSGPEACLSADDVSLDAHGVLTCADAVVNGDDYTDQAINSVNVSCATLSVDATATVDAAGKGWLPKTKSNNGYGPGAVGTSTTLRLAPSPSHGGFGSFSYDGNAQTLERPLPYGDAASPVTPGSSGAGSNWGTGSAGGGVIRVVATGTVTVNGTITAAGGDHPTTDGAPGSGGSIWITCHALCGSGVLSAKGGDGRAYAETGNRLVYPAGGGRIAVDYSPSAQAVADVTGLRITAESGVFINNHTTHADLDTACSPYLYPGQGTLHFTDGVLVGQLLGKGLWGDIRGLTAYTHSSDLDFASGYVRFGEDGVQVRVNGNLSLSGSDVRLDIGGSVQTNVYLKPVFCAGTTPASLDVTGDLTLSGLATLDVQAARVAGNPVGATVTVGGTLAVGANCTVIARSDFLQPSSPRFVVGNLTVSEGGLVTANAQGGKGAFKGNRGCYQGSVGSVGISQGSPVYWCKSGASHGGTGGYSTADERTKALSYDDPLRPAYPGSGGANGNSGWHVAGMGGGVISVAATNGTIRIDGTLDACGMSGYALADKASAGGGSGGTILLEAQKFFCSASGRLLADGGDAKPTSSEESYAAGGGRISIFAGAPYSVSLRPSRMTTVETPFAASAYPENFSCLGTVSVAGGTILGDYATNGMAGSAGTVRFTWIEDKKGLIVVFK